MCMSGYFTTYYMYVCFHYYLLCLCLVATYYVYVWVLLTMSISGYYLLRLCVGTTYYVYVWLLLITCIYGYYYSYSTVICGTTSLQRSIYSRISYLFDIIPTK